MTDFYTMLGLPVTASSVQIAGRIEELLQEYPPGTDQGKRLLEAENVLLNRSTRRKYDSQLKQASRPLKLPKQRGRNPWLPQGEELKESLAPFTGIGRNFQRVLRFGKVPWMLDFVRLYLVTWFFSMIYTKFAALPLEALLLLAVASFNWVTGRTLPERLKKEYLIPKSDPLTPEDSATFILTIVTAAVCIGWGRENLPTVMVVGCSQLFLGWYVGRELYRARVADELYGPSKPRTEAWGEANER